MSTNSNNTAGHCYMRAERWAQENMKEFLDKDVNNLHLNLNDAAIVVNGGKRSEKLERQQ